MSRHELYDGDVVINFSNKARNRYQVESTGKSPVGVTTILDQVLAKSGLMLWPLYEALSVLKLQVGQMLTDEHLMTAEGAYKVKSDKGKDVGSLFHEWSERYDKDQTTPLPEDADLAKMCIAYADWFTDNVAKVISTERIHYSRKFDYAGTSDLICLLKSGKVVLLDKKTSNRSRTAPLGIYDSYFLQCGAYSNAYTEETGHIIDDLMILNITKPKDGRVLVASRKASDFGLTVKHCENGFLNVLKLYRLLVPLREEIARQ